MWRFLLCFVVGLSARGMKVDGAWMSGIDGQRTLDRLSIPGTHNSGALHELIPGTAKCQSLGIGAQLACGVRFLDIRCRHIGDRFRIHHGPIDQKAGFEDVLAECMRFLVEQPGETVILSVMEAHKAQGNTRRFEETMADYIARDPSRWHLGESIPRLGSVRGKIVLFRRFPSAGALGINAHRFAGNGTFSVNLLRVQDRYRVADAGEKWDAIAAMLAETREAGPGKLHLNFTSGYVPGAFGLPNIPAVSKAVHPRLVQHLLAAPKAHVGIVVLDFATPELVGTIVQCNR